jgi:putative endonuclease
MKNARRALTTDTGKQAEAAAADYLYKLGYQIIGRNWKRPKLCEIDIVARLGRTVYFVEVKYRATDLQGGGLEYITADKLRRMRKAAVVWAQENVWRGGYQLAAIELNGPDFVVNTFVESISF